MLKKRQEKRQKRQKKRQKRQKRRQKKRQKRFQRQALNPWPLNCEHMHVRNRARHVSANIWLIGGIHSEHILVTGVTTQCLAEG